MIEYVLQLLRDYPECAVFLTVALGNVLGRIWVGPVQLGSVAGSLLVGVVIGMVGIQLPTIARTFFFLLFLFATGFAVGPQFFAGLRRDGLKQALFSLVICLICVGTSFAITLFMGWDAGIGSGLLAGANTSSIIIGIATDTLNGMQMDPQQRKVLIDNIPMAYAVTYIFGTAGTAWFMVAIGAKLLDKDVTARCKELEAGMGSTGKDEIRTAHERIGYRAYHLKELPDRKASMTVGELEKHVASQPRAFYVLRVASGSGHRMATPELVLHPGDRIAVMAYHELFPFLGNILGPEVADSDLLSFPLETARVMITNKSLVGRTLGNLRDEPQVRGLGLRWLKRGGVSMPIVPELVVQTGDQLEMIGDKDQLDVATQWIGFRESSGIETSIAMLSATIAVGIVVGLLEYRMGNVPITLSLSGGVLMMGLVMGWLRERYPRLGNVPPASLLFMQRIGLDLFIAMVGLTSSAGFISGLKSMGLQLFLAGVVVSIVPVLIGLLLGRYVFKFHPAITMGATAGARTEPASLAVVQNALKSSMPALGFTVPYAVANIVLAVLAVLMVVMLN